MEAQHGPFATRTLSVAANGLSFETLECGTGDRLALCLHGFPSHALCWRDQLPLLAGLGYRAWAPNLRGYGNTTRPPRPADYAIDTLLDDIAGLIDASGARSTVLIAHDWGGLLAWFFAARRIRPLDALIVMNVPHPACAAVAFRNWRQALKGWYMAAFQVPGLPDWLLRLNRAWLVGKLMKAVGGQAEIFSPEMLDFYRDAAAAPGATTAMLNWYRGMVQGGLPVEMKSGFPPIETPTMVVWGEADAVFGLSSLEGIEAHVPNIVIRRLPEISHWVQEEAPAAVNAMLEAFLTGRPVPHYSAMAPDPV